MVSNTLLPRRISEDDALKNGFIVRHDDNGNPVFIGLTYNLDCKPEEPIVGDLNIKNQCIFTLCDNATLYACLPVNNFFIFGYVDI